MDETTNPSAAEMPSPSTRNQASLWRSLPVEIRQDILVLMGLPQGQQSPNLSLLTAVCSEWQAFFEPYTFRRLTLDPDSLEEFDAMIRRDDTRLGCIRKLWLRVQLSTYECPNCDTREDEATRICNDMIFTRCIRTLLGTLKLWDPAKHGEEGLTLMLSASSPSDTEHRFDRCEIKDNYPYHFAEDIHLGSVFHFHRENMADPFNLYFHRGLSPPANGGHIRRAQGTPLQLKPRKDEKGRLISLSKDLPAVPVVKGLLMRRQFRREIQVKSLSTLLKRSFVALEWFRFERTISPDYSKQIAFDKGFRLRLLPSLPKTLRQFSFTQWRIPKIELGHGFDGIGSQVSYYAKEHLPQKMAKLSFRLEQFCPPLQMDAAAFLRSIIELGKSETMPESSLKRIILRRSLASPYGSRQDFEALVILAAEAALSLPHLQIIELWGTCLHRYESRAYIFRYICEGDQVRIVWRSCQEPLVNRDWVIAKWRAVVQKHGHRSLEYIVDPLTEMTRRIFSSDGTCIYRHLLLGDLAFDSLTQTILENEGLR